MSKLAIDFVPMEVLNKLPLDERVELILDKIKNKKIVVLNSRFDPRDEAILVQRTMESVSKTFTGVEICSLSSRELLGNNNLIARLKETVLSLLTGSKGGLTVIGPAKIVREIKREPDRISLFIK